MRAQEVVIIRHLLLIRISGWKPLKATRVSCKCMCWYIWTWMWVLLQQYKTPPWENKAETKIKHWTQVTQRRQLQLPVNQHERLIHELHNSCTLVSNWIKYNSYYIQFIWYPATWEALHLQRVKGLIVHCFAAAYQKDEKTSQLQFTISFDGCLVSAVKADWFCVAVELHRHAVTPLGEKKRKEK